MCLKVTYRLRQTAPQQIMTRQIIRDRNTIPIIITTETETQVIDNLH